MQAEFETAKCAGGDAAALLEELCWLLRCCAHLVADPADGERPEVPLPVADATQRAEAAGLASPLAGLAQELLDMACLAAEGRHGLSSRCMMKAPVCKDMQCCSVQLAVLVLPKSLGARLQVLLVCSSFERAAWLCNDTPATVSAGRRHRAECV